MIVTSSSLHPLHLSFPPLIFYPAHNHVLFLLLLLFCLHSLYRQHSSNRSHLLKFISFKVPHLPHRTAFVCKSVPASIICPVSESPGSNKSKSKSKSQPHICRQRQALLPVGSCSSPSFNTSTPPAQPTSPSFARLL